MMPYRWKKPRAVFVCSMSDLFHPLVPEEFIVRVFDSAIACYTHLFLLLTKRPERMRDTMTARCAGRNVNDPPRNIWLGVTAENQEAADKRLPVLAETPAVKRFVSCEPLLEAVHLDLRGIDWVIVGGESGPNHRPMQPEWARGLRDQCKQAGVAFYFKQQSALRPGQGVDALGGTYHEYPEVEGAACRL
jgi:protein gp37